MKEVKHLGLKVLFFLLMTILVVAIGIHLGTYWAEEREINDVLREMGYDVMLPLKTKKEAEA